MFFFWFSEGNFSLVAPKCSNFSLRPSQRKKWYTAPIANRLSFPFLKPVWWSEPPPGREITKFANSLRDKKNHLCDSLKKDKTISKRTPRLLRVMRRDRTFWKYLDVYFPTYCCMAWFQSRSRQIYPEPNVRTKYYIIKRIHSVSRELRIKGNRFPAWDLESCIRGTLMRLFSWTQSCPQSSFIWLESSPKSIGRLAVVAWLPRTGIKVLRRKASTTSVEKWLASKFDCA